MAILTLLAFAFSSKAGPLTLAGWGSSANGQLNFPPDLTNVVQVVGGGLHTAVLKADGSVAMWGDSNFGVTDVPTNLPPVKMLAGGAWHMLALLTNGTLQAWGWNADGQCNIPAGLSNVIAAAGGQQHSLALKADGTVVGWGLNNYGQISIPAGLSDVVAIAAGKAHSLALKRDGTLIGWGANYSGQLSLPVTTNVAMVATYATDNTLILTRDGLVYACGFNQYNQNAIPAGLSNVVGIASGGNIHMALVNDGTVQNWGSITPPPTNATNVVFMSAGPWHALALTSDGSPTITVQPVGTAVVISNATSFRAQAVGALPLDYQWRFNGVAIPNATNVDLVFASAQPPEQGSYDLVVTNSFGAVTSQVAVLIVNEPPSITNQPQSVTTGFGVDVTFNVGVHGTPPLTYQWSFNGVNIAAAVNSSLTLSNVLADRAGNYQVVAGNPFGVVTSGIVTLSVTTSPPVITSQLPNLSVTKGAEVVFTGVVPAQPPTAFQWLFNDAPIEGATNSTLLFTNAQMAGAGSYRFIATNQFGSVTSAVATLTVTPPPGWLWARAGGGTNSDNGKCVAVDTNGNVYVAGYFEGAGTFGTSNLVSAGNSDIFLAKYDSGGRLLWLRQAGGTNFDFVNAIAVDLDGGVFITGEFYGMASFDGVWLTNTVNSDLFIAKYDPEGSLVWARSFAGSNAERGAGITIDAARNVWLTGNFSDTLDLGITTLFSISGLDTLFLARLDTNGNALWASKANSFRSSGDALVMAPGGDVLIAGTFAGHMTWGGLTVTNASGSQRDAFIARCDSTGKVLWIKQAGGSANDAATALGTDPEGNVYVTGNYGKDSGGSATFDGVVLTTIGGAGDMFIAKYDPAGKLAWVRSAGGTATDSSSALAVDAGGNAYIGGSFLNTAYFGATNLVSSGGADAFVVAYSGGGDVLWARKGARAGVQSMALDSRGNAFVTGWFGGSSPTTAIFGHVVHTNAGWSDFFHAKFALFDPTTPPVFTVHPSNQIAVAGADVVLTGGYFSAPTVAKQWLFNGVEIVGATNLSLTLSNAGPTQVGEYSLVLSNANGSVTSAVATVGVTVEPDFIWARRGGGASTEMTLATLAGGAADVYIAGYFTDTADFNGTQLVSNGGEDIFIARYTSAGTLLWAKQFGGPGNERATGLALPINGGVAVCGNYSGDFAMDGFALTNRGGSDVFLSRLDSAGNVSWAVSGGGAYDDIAFAIATHSVAQGIYVTGSFRTNATFGSTTLTDSSTTNKLFIAKYNDNGSFSWAATSTGNGPTQGRALACDAGNYVYVGGTCAGSANFGGQILASTGALSGFVVKYSSGGNFPSWVRRFGTATNTPSYPLRINGLAFDPNGNLLVVGDFRGEVSFFGTNSTLSLTPNQTDGFLLQLDGAGTAQWVKSFNGLGADTAAAVATDSLGNAHATGTFSNRVSVGNTTINGAGGSDVFAALVDATGTVVKLRRAGGAGEDMATSVSVGELARTFVGGAHTAVAAFGTNSLANAGGADVFVTRLELVNGSAPPQITTQPRSQSVAQGSNAVLRIGVLSSSMSPTYSWRLNGAIIPGAVNNSYALSNMQLSKAGDYTIVVQNIFGTTTSAVAKVTLEVPPEYHWLQRSGGTGDDQALAVAVDATNAIYVAGFFSGVNPALSNLTSVGGTDIFLAKYDGAGNFLWARRAGGTGADAAQALRVDTSGNVWLAGHFFSSTATFGNITLTNKSAPTAAHGDLFVAKYDANGNPLWVRQGGGSGNPNIINQSDTATGLALDAEGNGYLTGSYHSTMDLAGTQLDNRGSTNFFMAKFHPNGGLLWARTTTGTNYSLGNGICVDAATNVYVTGFHFGSLNLGSGSLTNTNSPFVFGNATGFVAKYDRNGNIQWTRRAPGSGGYGQAIVADAFDCLYATSYKRDYGTGVGLTKYDAAGNALWFRTAAISCCTGDYTSMAGLALDPFGNPIIAGYGNGTIEGITNSFQGGYVLKYRSDGSGYWILRCASQAATGTGSAAVAVDSAGHAVIAGRFNGTSSFGPFGAGTSNLVSAGGNDAFVVKLGLRPPALSALGDKLVVAGSNATLQVTTAASPVLYQWQLNGTNLAGATNALLALSNFNFGKAGRYSVVIQGAGGATTSAVVGVGVIPVLGVATASNGVALNWDGLFTLQSAAEVSGPFTDSFTGTGPRTNAFGPDEFQRYFRLRVPSPDVNGVFTSTKFALNFLGAPGRRYTIQTSTNLVNWTPVMTDVFPFGYQDPNPAPQKFYRAVLEP